MRKIKLFSVILFISGMCIHTLSAGIIGDISGDGQVDLTEAIYALQIESGVNPNIPINCIITGRGDWEVGKYYNKCDVVNHDGSYYICTQSHTATSPPSGIPEKAIYLDRSDNHKFGQVLTFFSERSTTQNHLQHHLGSCENQSLCSAL